MTTLAAALLAELDVDTLAELAERLAPLLAKHNGTTAQPEPWLDVAGAAAHLGCSTSRIYELSHKRRSNHFPVHKDGSRSYFKASELDAWRLSARARP